MPDRLILAAILLIALGLFMAGCILIAAAPGA
jgi:hypothetical protein